MYTVAVNAVIIDFDGTIADSFDHVLDFLLTQAGRQAATVTSEQRQALKGLSMKELALQVGIPRWKLPFVYFRGKAAMNKRMHATPMFDGMGEALAALHKEQYTMYILSSNSRRNINRFLLEHGLSSYFKRVYGNAGWFGKGSSLKKALEKDHLDPQKTVYVGDETRDIIAAHYAGMPAVAVSWGFGSEAELLKQNPTILARRPSELQKSLIDWGRTL